MCRAISYKKSWNTNYYVGLNYKYKTKYGILVRYAQCDHAGKNVDFKWACKQEGVDTKFEYTAPGTPQ